MPEAAEFDHALHLDADTALRTASTPPRRVLAAIATRRRSDLLAALGALQPASDPLGKGVYLLGRATLGDYAAARAGADAFRASSHDPEALEGAIYAMIAGAVADTELGQPEQAVARLHSAHLLSGMLGMVYRAQWTLLEGQRLRLSLGSAQPEELDRAAAITPMNAARATWAAEIKVAALLSRGRYREAASLAPEVSGIRAFAMGLLGETVPASPDGSYGSLALALHALRREEDPERFLASVTGQPEMGYATLLRLAARVRDKDCPLALETPVAPDQRLAWSLLMWERLAQGLPVVAAHVLVTLMQALRELDEAGEVLRSVYALAPVATAAFLASPLGDRGEGLEVPILLGEHLRWQGELHKLPGRRGGGQALVLQALGQEREVSRVERLRLRRALDHLALPIPPVNVAHLLHALACMTQVAQAPAWRQALSAVTDAVTGRAAQREIRRIYAPLVGEYAEHG